MKNVLGLVVFVFIVFWLWNSVISLPKFIGFYYPNAGDLLTYEQSPELDALY